MSFDWWTFALQTANFAILVWLLQRFLYRPVLHLIDTRREHSEQDLAEAEHARAQAQQQLKEIASERARIDDERTSVLKAAADQAEAAAAARREQAEHEVQVLVEDARKSLETEREQALAEVRRAATGLGIDIARRLLAEVPVPLRAQAWLDHIEQYLAQLTAEERADFRHGLQSHPLRVVTATDLPEPTRAQWRERLHALLEVRNDIEFDVDPELIAGAELHFPTAIVRFSWREALASLQEELGANGDAH